MPSSSSNSYGRRNHHGAMSNNEHKFTPLWHSGWFGAWPVIWMLWKMAVRFVFGECELQRICRSDQIHTAYMSHCFEYSFARSRTLRDVYKSLRNGYIDHRVAATRIANVKNKPLGRWKKRHLFACLSDIARVHRVRRYIESLRAVKYQVDNVDHEKQLIRLWRGLMPNVQLLSRESRQWMEIGFQGEDPSTDFRAMGILGLEQLSYLTHRRSKIAHQILKGSHHPKYEYSMAIVGINLTGFCLDLLRDGDLHAFMFANQNVDNVAGSPKHNHTDELRGEMSDEDKARERIHQEALVFHEAYVQLFMGFNDYWISCKPRNMMAFTPIFKDFTQKVHVLLANKERWRHKKTFSFKNVSFA